MASLWTPSADDQLQKMWYRYRMKFCSFIKRMKFCLSQQNIQLIIIILYEVCLRKANTTCYVAANRTLTHKHTHRSYDSIEKIWKRGTLFTGEIFFFHCNLDLIVEETEVDYIDW